jgi:hypothetical protein
MNTIKSSPQSICGGHNQTRRFLPAQPIPSKFFMKTTPTMIHKILAAITVLALLAFAPRAQATAYTAAGGGGEWTSSSTWTAGSGYPSASSDTFTIGSGITVTMQSGDSISIASGTTTGTLTISNSASLTLSGNMTITTTTGNVNNNGALTIGGTGSGSGTLTQGNNANFTFTQSNGGAPSFTIAATAPGNTVTYSGSGPAVKVTTYQNLTFSYSGSSSYSWSSSIIVNGTLTAGLGSTSTALNNVQGTFGAITVNGGAITANAAINVSGNLTVTSGTLYAQTGLLTVSGTTTVNGGTIELGSSGATFTGNFALSTGTFNSSFSGQNGPVTFGGSLTVSGGTFTESTGTTAFSGSGQTITGTITIPSMTVNGTYANAGTLTVSTALAGSGTLTQNANSTLNLGGTAATLTLAASANTPNMVAYTKSGTQTVLPTTYYNLTLSGTSAKTVTGVTVNNILSMQGTATATGTAPTYGGSAILAYQGTASQTTGIELPTSPTAVPNLTISNSAGVVLGTNVTVSSALTLTSGALSIGAAHTLTLNGTIAIISGSLTGSATSGITCSGSTALTLPAVASGLENLTINNTGGVTLGSALSLASNGTLTLTAGALNNSTANITLAAGDTISINTGSLNVAPVFGGTVNVTYTGTTAINTGPEIPTSSTVLTNLTVNNSGGVTLSGAAKVNGTLTLTAGALSSAGNLTIATGDNIFINSGSLSGTPTFSGTVNVTYNGSGAINTGTEIPSSTSALNNLTNADSAGVTLSGAATVNGTLTLTSGSFAVGANTLTLNGPTIAGTPANLSTTSSSSLVYGGSSGSVSIPSSVTALKNLTINNTSGVTLNSSPTLSGTLTVGAGATLNFNSDKITVASAPSLAGALKMEVAKTGANTFTGSKLTQSAGTLTYGGTLTVTASGQTLALNDSIPLFSAGSYGGGFSTVSGPTTPAGLTTNVTQLTGGTGGNELIVCSGTLAASAAASTTICNGSSYALNGSASGGSGSGYTYSWTSSPSGFTSSSANPTVTPSVTTTYTLTVTDANGCTASTTVTVTVNAAAGVTLNHTTDTICGNSTESVTATPSGGATGGNWTSSGTGSFSSTTAAATVYTPSAADITAGSVTLTTTTTGQTSPCGAATATDVVTINAPPVVSGQPSSSTNCVGDTASFTVTTSDASDLYQWFTNGVALTNGATGNGSTIGGATNATLAYTNVQAADAVTNIYCVLSNTNGCSTTTTTNVSLTVNPLPTAYSVTGGGSYCAGGSGVDVQLSSSDSGVNYQLYVGATPVGPAMAGNSGQAIDFGDQITAGTYTVVATSASTGCTATMSGSATVTVNPLPVVSGQPSSSTNCVGTTASFTVSTSDVSDLYQWFTNGVALTNGATGNGSTIGGATNATLAYTNVQAADAVTNIYCVLSNTNGCSTTTTNVSLTVNPLPTAMISPSSTNICSGSSATLTASSSASAPSYVWSDGETTPSITVTPVATTNYTVTVTDGTTGCANTSANATVTVNALPTTSAISGTNSVSAGEAGVTYSVALTGGSSYAWTVPGGATITAGGTGPNNNQITVTFGVTSGNVGVTETNSSGCTGTPQTLAVTVKPTLLTVTLSGNTLTINWGGTQTLESASNLIGPWTPVTTNTGPYTINVTAQPQQFYRCVAP